MKHTYAPKFPIFNGVFIHSFTCFSILGVAMVEQHIQSNNSNPILNVFKATKLCIRFLLPNHEVVGS